MTAPYVMPKLGNLRHLQQIINTLQHSNVLYSRCDINLCQLLDYESQTKVHKLITTCVKLLIVNYHFCPVLPHNTK